MLDEQFMGSLAGNDSAMNNMSWLPIPLQRNQYAVAQYRATYPKEPYRQNGNRTILYETTLHAVECAKSRTTNFPASTNTSSEYKNKNMMVTKEKNRVSSRVSAVYVASDTGAWTTGKIVY